MNNIETNKMSNGPEHQAITSNVSNGTHRNWAQWMIENLKKSGIELSIAEAYGMFPANDGNSYIIQYFDPVTGGCMLDANGEQYMRRRMQGNNPKYIAKVNSGIRCYIPPKAHSHYSNDIKNIPLLITEGEKKAIYSGPHSLTTKTLF